MKDDDDKVVSIGPSRKVSGRVLAWCGESTEKKLAIGMVRAMMNGAVLFTDPAGKDYELTDAEARAVDRAFSTAAYAASVRKEDLSGFNAVRVTSVAYREGKATILRDVGVTWHHVTHRMRLSILRPTRWAPQGRTCTNCKKPALALYVARETHEKRGKPPHEYKGDRIHHAEVCVPCVEALSAIPKGVLREI